MNRPRLAARLSLVIAFFTLGLAVSPRASVVDYDIVYVRAPRFGDNPTKWPEVFAPTSLDPGADLMLLHPDGSEEVLVAGGRGAVTDPFLSFDAQWCYYAYFHNLQPNELAFGRGMPKRGSDIYRIHLKTRVVQRLTHQEFTPNTGAGNWDTGPIASSSSRNSVGFGVFNLGPAPIAGGRIIFTSSRNAFAPTKTFTSPTLQLFVMDEDGENVTPIAPMTLGSALHPVPLVDGRVLFSSYESQGVRDDRLWGLWTIFPDGRQWQPMVSAFIRSSALHFATQLSSGDMVVEDYYNRNNSGFGAYYRFPLPSGDAPPFHGATLRDNPRIEFTYTDGRRTSFSFPFSPRGIASITPMTHGLDHAAPRGADGARVGKFTHPSGAPGGDLLTVWTPGPANDLLRPPTPYYDGGLYVIRGARPVQAPSDLVLLKNDPRYNEVWPRAVVPYRAIYGVDEPAALPWLPNDGAAHPLLPRGTPYGIVGTSSFYKRESAPGVFARTSYGALDVFNTTVNEQNSNWLWQGADAGVYTSDDIFAVRIVGLEPNSQRTSGPHAGQHFVSHANERMRILGEIPLRKVDAAGQTVLDPEGNPDTSFAARIPADTPFTFQMLDRDGLVLTIAQTWHQVRPGEVRTDCGGCHAHSLTPLAFDSTAAARPEYRIADLTSQRSMLTAPSHSTVTTKTVAGGAVDVEFYRDIRPILQRSCVGCHTRTQSPAPGNLVLDDYTLENGLPGDYRRLASDPNAKFGIPPVVKVSGKPTWRQTNASRYVRMFQSRRSLLAWKIFGRRLDGWTNASHPTESEPGNAATLPAGASANAADLDYTGTIMPPPESGVPALMGDEKLTIARWIDLGAPIDKATTNGHAGYGWFLDEVRPTLTISLPRPNVNAGPLTEIRIGVADAYSGLDPTSLSVIADVPLAGRAAGAELVRLGSYVGDGIFSIPLKPSPVGIATGRLTVRVRDRKGNESVQQVRFSVGQTAAAPR